MAGALELSIPPAFFLIRDLGYSDPEALAEGQQNLQAPEKGVSSSDPHTLTGQLCTLTNGCWFGEHKQVSPCMPWYLIASQQVCFLNTDSLMTPFHLDNHGNGTVHTEWRGVLFCFVLFCFVLFCLV